MGKQLDIAVRVDNGILPKNHKCCGDECSELPLNERNPVDKDGLECCWCYAKSLGGSLKHSGELFLLGVVK